ncbi:hypothetical protein OUZ56_008374 [Daphnia magna]|uniref:Ig-like domain-containing protein n=1 Tax=Daphnia magna TaxID=35525 RepID=A0ABR0AD62_9CRUS|nr:hypothetical protein OUZ56_008374 [Daphnia magna]
MYASRCNEVNQVGPAPSEWAVVEASSSSSATTYVADADFDAMPTEVRVAAGTTAYLSCRPRSLRNKTVSWVRHRDLHILSVGRSVYTKDGRFSVYHQRHTGEWTLQLRSVQLKDSGLYECQIGTQPTRSYFVHLQVVGKPEEVLPGKWGKRNIYSADAVDVVGSESNKFAFAVLLPYSSGASYNTVLLLWVSVPFVSCIHGR